MLTSRRQRYTGAYSFIKTGAILEPGDPFEVDSVDSSIQAYVRMEDMEINFLTGDVTFECIESYPLDYGPILAAIYTEYETKEENVHVGAFVRVTGVPDGSVPSGTAIRLEANVIGTTATVDSYAWEGTNLSSTNTNVTTWTPTASGSVTVTARVSDCDLTATVNVTIAVATAPSVKIVAQGGRRYGVIAQGFTGTPTHAWTLSQSQAGTLSSSTASSILVSGGDDMVLGTLAVKSTSGTQTATDTILVPYLSFDDERGGENTVNGQEVVF